MKDMGKDEFSTSDHSRADPAQVSAKIKAKLSQSA